MSLLTADFALPMRDFYNYVWNLIMFTENTVFILGAGASWHYNFPTGEDLIREIIKQGSVLTQQILDKKDNLGVNTNQIKEIANWCGVKDENQYTNKGIYLEKIHKLSLLFQKKLSEFSPLVIDYFLGQNEDLQAIGKLLIAYVILNHEKKLNVEPFNQNPPSNDGDKRSQSQNDWYKYLLHKLTTKCYKSADLLDNQVTFITFNYDISLEYHLFNRLNTIQLFEETDINTFLSNGRILHVYGKVREEYGNYGSINENNSQRAAEPLILAWKAAQGIKTINDKDKNDNLEIINLAQTAITKANRVFILGYGFDENNNERIMIDTLLKGDKKPVKRVFFTNFCDSNKVNGTAGSMFGVGRDGFYNKNIQGDEINYRQGSRFYYEKSTRTVFDALKWDFEL